MELALDIFGAGSMLADVGPASGSWPATATNATISAVCLLAILACAGLAGRRNGRASAGAGTCTAARPARRHHAPLGQAAGSAGA